MANNSNSGHHGCLKKIIILEKKFRPFLEQLEKNLKNDRDFFRDNHAGHRHTSSLWRGHPCSQHILLVLNRALTGVTHEIGQFFRY